MTIKDYFSGLFGGIASLATGMSVTIKELFAKKITQQYPENRETLVIPTRAKGELYMPVDDNNEHACTACCICMMNCPNGTIKVEYKMEEQPDGKKKKVLTRYNYDLGMCTFCNLCVITCPSDAIFFKTDFEGAVYRRSSLKMKLNPEGSKLREKKKAPKADAPTTDAAAKPKPEPKVEATKVDETKKQSSNDETLLTEN